MQKRGYCVWSRRTMADLTWVPYVTLLVNTLRPRQNGLHLPDDIFKCIFFNENVWISIKIPLKFVPKGPINNIPALVQIMAWRRPGDKPLSEPFASLGLNELSEYGRRIGRNQRNSNNGEEEWSKQKDESFWIKVFETDLYITLINNCVRIRCGFDITWSIFSQIPTIITPWLARACDLKIPSAQCQPFCSDLIELSLKRGLSFVHLLL